MIARESLDGQIGRGRQTARLGVGLEKRLSAYAGAAAAAGVGLLALTPPAEAKIVYTPVNISIPVNGGWVPLDLNHDGTADFSFSNLSCTGDEGEFWMLLLGQVGDQGNAMWGKGGLGQRQKKYGVRQNCYGGYSRAFASALHPNFRVRPNKSHFQPAKSGWLMARTAGSYNRATVNSFGQWLFTQDRYLGLKFMVGGQIHYGWARFSVTLQKDKGTVQATLTGYAYETVPNKPIITGKTKGPDVITLEPASLGHLAQGAAGISTWRKAGGDQKSATR
jgi:hypothetical protein